jgi:hypothetical protein
MEVCVGKGTLQYAECVIDVLELAGARIAQMSWQAVWVPYMDQCPILRLGLVEPSIGSQV